MIQYLQRQNNEYAASNESLRTQFDAINLKYNELVESSSKTDAINRVTIEALQSKVVDLESATNEGGPGMTGQSRGSEDEYKVAMQEVDSLRMQLSRKERMRTAQQLILVNGIVGSAHYACFIPAVLEAITLQPSTNSLKYLSICAGFNALNGFYALMVLPKSKQSGQRMVQYLAFSNVLSITASAYIYFKKPNLINSGYLMLSTAANVGLLSFSLFMIPKLERIENESEMIQNETILDSGSLMVSQ